MKLKILQIVLMFSLLALTSCTPRVKIKLNDKNEVFVDIDITHTDSTKRLIKSLNNLGNSSMFEGKDENIENVKGDDGVEILRLKKSSELDISAKFKFSNTSQLYASLFSVDKKEQRMIFSLNRSTINVFFEQISKEDKEYLDLLMAPSLQNTKMSEDEYIVLLANAYGSKVSQELKTSHLYLIFEMPKKIKKVQFTPLSQHKINGNKVEIHLPLTRVLVMNKDIEIIIDY